MRPASPPTITQSIPRKGSLLHGSDQWFERQEVARRGLAKVVDPVDATFLSTLTPIQTFGAHWSLAELLRGAAPLRQYLELVQWARRIAEHVLDEETGTSS